MAGYKLYYKIRVQAEAEALKKVIGDLAEMITTLMKYTTNRKEIDAVLKKGFEKKSDVFTEVLDSRMLGETGYQFKWAKRRGGAYELVITVWQPQELDYLLKHLTGKIPRYLKEKQITYKEVTAKIHS